MERYRHDSISVMDVPLSRGPTDWNVGSGIPVRQYTFAMRFAVAPPIARPIATFH